MPEGDVVAALEADGLVQLERGALRPTARWRAAVARAALRLQASGAPFDLRLPIAAALVELRPELPDGEIAARVEALLPLQAASLGAFAAAEPHARR